MDSGAFRYRAAVRCTALRYIMYKGKGVLWMEEKKDGLEELRQKAAPLAKQFLEDPEMLERLKKASPGLSEEHLVEMLRQTVNGFEDE